MALSALECPDGICHSHHGGHAVERDVVLNRLEAHGNMWCERLAERVYEISVDSFCQSVMPHLHGHGWQRRHLEWEFKLDHEPAEVERTVVDGTINAMESFLRSSEVQRLFIQEVVQGTLAEAGSHRARGAGIRWLIEDEVLGGLRERRDELVERLTRRLLDDAGGNPELARSWALDGLNDVEHLLVNHAEAMG